MDCQLFCDMTDRQNGQTDAVMNVRIIYILVTLRYVKPQLSKPIINFKCFIDYFGGSITFFFRHDAALFENIFLFHNE